MDMTLVARLSQWSPTDSLFRKVAFAVLCLASGAKNVALLPDEHYMEKQAQVNYVSIPKGKPSEDLVMTANGAHSGIFPLLAPVKAVYWFDGVLVHLAFQIRSGRPPRSSNLVHGELLQPELRGGNC